LVALGQPGGGGAVLEPPGEGGGAEDGRGEEEGRFHGEELSVESSQIIDVIGCWENGAGFHHRWRVKVSQSSTLNSGSTINS
jgi:hypothetical protein